MKIDIQYIAILFLLISCGSHQVDEPSGKDTVIIYDYLRGNDTLIIDTSKKCQKQIIHEQMERMSKLNKKLERIKKRLERTKRNNGY
jgi:hypothetical protein